MQTNITTCVYTLFISTLLILSLDGCHGSKQTGPYWDMTEESGLSTTFGYGRGAAFVDFNGDGLDDLFVADCDARYRVTEYGVSQFFLNRGDGTFKEVDLGVFHYDLYGTFSGSFADYDNDGDPDLIIAGGGYSVESDLVVYENQVTDSGVFINTTEAMGVAPFNIGPQGLKSRWWSTSFADFDNDGYLDLVATRTDGRPLLFKNREGSSFVEVGRDHNITVGDNRPDCDLKNAVWWDHDTDGDADLYVAGRKCHAFYENTGGGFVDATQRIFGSILPPERPEVFTAGVEDFNQDGNEDLYLGRWDQQDYILINQGDGSVVLRGREFGLDMAIGDDPLENTMGLGIGDIYDDGYPDILIGTGNPSTPVRDLLFCNDQGRRFYRCGDTLHLKTGPNDKTRGHGVAFADIDHDGDTDVFINLGGHPGYDHGFFHHVTSASENESRQVSKLLVQQASRTHNTASLSLVGTISNREAIGTRVKVTGTRPHFYKLRSTQGFMSQNSRRLTVTLGQEQTAEVEVHWPSNQISTLTLRADQHLVIYEPSDADEPTMREGGR